MIEFKETRKHSIEMTLKAIINPTKVKEAPGFMSEYKENTDFI